MTNDLQTLKEGEVILFKADVNVGGCYDDKTGMFTAKIKGWYKFSFAVATSSTDTPAAVALQLNSVTMVHAISDYQPKASPQSISQASNQLIVLMVSGDKAKVVGVHHNSGPIVGSGFTTFNGHLLQAA